MIAPKEVSHDLSLMTHGPVEQRLGPSQERVYLTYDAVWRGKPVVVVMAASRYMSSSGMTNWHVGVHDARYVPTEGQWRGAELTALAQGRLRDQFIVPVQEWLASDAYAPSASTAYTYAVQGIARDLRPYGDDPAADLKLAVKRNRCKLSDADAQRLRQTASLYNAFCARLNNKPIEGTA